MIEVKGLSKSFEGVKALDGANVTVNKGSIYGLLGPNGAGKSTLLRHLTGVYQQDEGTVLIGGQPVWENVSVKAKIASIPDNWFYYSNFTIGEMKEMYKGIYPLFSEERFNKLQEVFKMDLKSNIRNLSKGMTKQVAFWLALSTMPDYLLLDEPVDGLDPVMRRNVWSLMMDDVASRGTTVVVSSHNLRELEDVCDHIGIMNGGKVVLERSLSELQDNMVKLQVVFKDENQQIPEDLLVLHDSVLGRVHTMIVRMCPESALRSISKCDTLLAEALPLTLEEIFIYEMGGLDNDIRNKII